MKNYSPGASNSLTSADKQNKNNYGISLDCKKIAISKILLHLQYVSFLNAQNLPSFKISRGLYLLLLTTMAFVTSGKYVTPFFLS